MATRPVGLARPRLAGGARSSSAILPQRREIWAIPRAEAASLRPRSPPPCAFPEEGWVGAFRRGNAPTRQSGVEGTPVRPVPGRAAMPALSGEVRDVGAAWPPQHPGFSRVERTDGDGGFIRYRGSRSGSAKGVPGIPPPSPGRAHGAAAAPRPSASRRAPRQNHGNAARSVTQDRTRTGEGKKRVRGTDRPANAVGVRGEFAIRGSGRHPWRGAASLLTRCPKAERPAAGSIGAGRQKLERARWDFRRHVF